MKTLCLRLGKPRAARLAAAARKTGRTKSAVVRSILDEFLARSEAAVEGSCLDLTSDWQARRRPSGPLRPIRSIFAGTDDESRRVAGYRSPVALLNRRDQYHEWAKLQWANTAPPFLTCEAVLSEACYLLRAATGGSGSVIELLRRNVVQVAFHVEDHAENLAQLIRKYANVPMSLADACLLRMAELAPEIAILTLDRDFRIYRKGGRRAVPVILPEQS